MINVKAEEFIDTLYDELYDKLLAFAESALNDSNAAEDAVQDTFLVAMSRADKVLESPNPQGWLFLTLKNIIKETRKNKLQLIKWILYVSPEELSNIAVEDKPLIDDVDTLYEDFLQYKDFALLKKRVLEKYSISELASENGMTIGACKERLCRIKVKLLKKIEKQQKK